MIHTNGMFIPYKSQQGNGSFPSWTTAICDRKCRNTKFSRSLPVMCATVGHPGTGHLSNWITPGKYTTEVVGPSPFLSTPLV